MDLSVSRCLQPTRYARRSENSQTNLRVSEQAYCFCFCFCFGFGFFLAEISLIVKSLKLIDNNNNDNFLKNYDHISLTD